MLQDRLYIFLITLTNGFYIFYTKYEDPRNYISLDALPLERLRVISKIASKCKWAYN